MEIPTAQEFNYRNNYLSDEQKLIAFAKLHVEAALKSANKMALRSELTEEDLEEIYPLTNIK